MNISSENLVYEIVPVSKSTGVRFYTSYDSGSYVPPHWHDAIEIVYMQKGSLDYTIESHTKILRPGDCMLLNANAIHRMFQAHFHATPSQIRKNIVAR